MRLKLFAVLHHSILMVGRTIRNYVMLSMTVVLSFSILLGYLLFTDSSLYNQNKIYLNSDGRIVIIPNVTSIDKMDALLNQAENIGTDTAYYVQRSVSISVDSFWGQDRLQHQNVYIIPSHVWGIYDQDLSVGVRAMNITWLDGREATSEVYLRKNEILLERGIYEYLQLDEMEEPVYEIRMPVIAEDGAAEVRCINAAVVGLIETGKWLRQTDGTYELHRVTIYMSQASVQESDKISSNRDIIFSSDAPAAIKNAAISIGLDSYITMYQPKERALQEMTVHTETKAIITMVLCVLLAINLYGSFSNAMQNRKFEVGVKRAIGASKFSIIRQFLWEGIIVMLGNIYLSMMIIMNGALIYKYVYQFIENETWTIYLSAASIAMFGVVTISLTVIFSLVFAVQATEVEIVQYLKSE